MFHHFHQQGERPLGQGSITGDEFDNILREIKLNNNLLSASEWLKKAKENTLEDCDVCITFDDNLIGQYEVALPILEKHNLTAFWFIYTSPLVGTLEKLELYRFYRCYFFNDIDEFYSLFEKTLENSIGKKSVATALAKVDLSSYLSAFPFYTYKDKWFRYFRDEVLGEDKYYEIMDNMISNSNIDLSKVSEQIWFNENNIRNLASKGHIIGLHSHTHPTRLAKLNYSDQHNEYKTNYEILTKITSKKIEVSAHPTNSYNKDTIEILSSLGIILSFRSNMVGGNNSKFEYSRKDHALLK